MSGNFISSLVGARAVISGAVLGSVAWVGAFAAGRWVLGIVVGVIAVAMVVGGLLLVKSHE